MTPDFTDANVLRVLELINRYTHLDGKQSRLKSQSTTATLNIFF